MFIKFVIFSTVLFINLCFGAKFPANLPRCKFEDSECLTKTITEYLSLAKNGISGIDLVPLSPLFVPALSIIQGNKSPVNIQLHFKNSTVSGVEDLIVTKVNGLSADPTKKSEIYIKAPKIILKGKYDIKGQVLILPIVGVGDSRISCENVDTKLAFTLKPIEKRSNYVRIDKIKLHFNPKFVQFHFGNLFNGDKLLGDTTNQFLNENWNEIFNEIKPSLVEAIEKIIENIINNVFNKIPYKEAFIN